MGGYEFAGWQPFTTPTAQLWRGNGRIFSACDRTFQTQRIVIDCGIFLSYPRIRYLHRKRRHCQ